MDTVPYTSHSYGETVTVDAFHPAPGLYVYQLPEHQRHPLYPWNVGHSSGRVIAAYPNEADALDAAAQIADFTRWDRTADEIRNDELLDPYELWDFIESSTSGVFITADLTRPTQAA